jgi:hypothetical protein
MAKNVTSEMLQAVILSNYSYTITKSEVDATYQPILFPRCGGPVRPTRWKMRARLIAT